MDKAVLNAVVTLCNHISPWLIILQVVPDGWDFPEYAPGQIATLGLFGCAPRCTLAEPEKVPVDPEKLIRRAYSIASSSENREFLEFYIALVPGGALTPRLFNLKIGDRISLSKKAVGTLTFDETQVPQGSNVVLVSTSSGIAPFLSMLSTHLRFPADRKVALLHGVRHSWDLGYRSVLMAMENLRSNFTYIPVLSEPEGEVVPWKGARGIVQDVWRSGVIEKAWGLRPKPDNTHVYICGNPKMSEAMIALLEQEGFQEKKRGEPGQIHVEKYWQ